jgi:hypothetical protein
MKNSIFENYPDSFLIKVCKYLINSNVNFGNHNELFRTLDVFTKNIDDTNPTTSDISFIQNLYKLNESKLKSNATDSLTRPELKTYEVPYTFTEEFTMKYFMEKEVSCYGDKSEAGEILDNDFNEGIQFLDDGNEIDKDLIHSEYSHWDIDNDEITEI